MSLNVAKHVIQSIQRLDESFGAILHERKFGTVGSWKLDQNSREKIWMNGLKVDFVRIKSQLSIDQFLHRTIEKWF